MKRLLLMIVLLLATGVICWVIYFQNTPSLSLKERSAPLNKSAVIELTFGHNTPKESSLHLAAVRFAEEIERKSGGRLVIKVFPAQQLGNDHQMVEMARRGELDILLTPTAKMSVPLPSMQYADLPFFFPSREDVYAMLDGEPGALLLDDLRRIGLVGVTFWENGFKHFTANTPLLSPDDFKGKKIRVMKSRIIMDQFKAFGAEPIPIDFHATKQALADGVVDGEENPLIAIVSMGFYEVQSDLTLSAHAYLGYLFSISEKTFETLPQELRMLLIETAKEITPWEREETRKREQLLLETIKKAGVHVHTLSDVQRQHFAERTAFIAQKYEGVIGADVISKTQELLLEKYGPDPKSHKQIVIGIDTDLSMDGHVAGLAIKRGVELAVNEINAKGGVLGKPLVILAKDNRVIPSLGVKNLEYFINREDVVGVIGGKHGTVITGEMPHIQKAKIPYLIPWSAAMDMVENGYEDNYVFRVSANDRLASDYIAAYALQQYKRPALVMENSFWGRSNLEQMRSYLSRHGINPVASIIYNRGQKSFEQEMRKIINAGADSIIMVANPKEGALIVQTDAAQPKPLPIISHWGIIGGKFYEESKEALAHLDLRFFQTFSFGRQNNPVSEKLEKAYRNAYGLDATDSIKAAAGVAHAYDLTHLLARAIAQAGSTEREKVKHALENLSVCDGAVKRYNPPFTYKQHDALDGRDYYMARFGANGKIIPVTPVSRSLP